ncbi:MAG: protein kinase [Myxococcales bacterium]|nr:protein kinase [Myxococcales bacterium]
MVSSHDEGALLGGRYRLIGELGRGGVAVVYRALDTSLGREVALKRLSRAEQDSKQATLRRLFEREYLTLVEIEHPGIVHAYDYYTDEEHTFYVMELLDGDDLVGLSPMPYRQVCAVLREVAAALSLLHARKLLHRDITPRNLRARADGHIKLIDFGALCDFGRVQELVGTPPYVAPEILDGAELDQRVDMFSLGAVAYWMLTGHKAYAARSFEELPGLWAAGVQPPSARTPEHDRKGQPLPAIPQALDQLVLGLLQPDPMARLPSAAAVIARLEALSELAPSADMDAADAHLASAPLSGRRATLRHLERAVARAPGGRGAAMLLEGEAGTGKSRLLGAMAVRAQLAGALVVTVNAAMQRGAYSTIAALVNALMQAAPGQTLQAARAEAGVLGHLVPELLEQLPEVALAPRPPEPVHWRTQALSALRSLWLGLAQQRTLVLAVDDIQRCDEQSAVALGAVAHAARHHPLLLLCSQRSDEQSVAPVSVEALREACEVAHIAGLSQGETVAWLDAIFGEADGVARLAHDLHRRSAGNPAHMAELLRFQIGHGHIKLDGGMWRLPAEPGVLELPERLLDALAGRLRTLDRRAQWLASAASMYRGPLTHSMCERLIDAEDRSQLDARIEQLVQAKVWVADGQQLRFAQPALQVAARAAIAEERKAELHLRVAEAMLLEAPSNVVERLEIGVHLAEAGDDRCRAIIAKAGIQLILHYQEMAACIPLLERALELYRDQKRSHYEMSLVLAPLAAASYLVDRRLDRHSDEALEHLEAATGLALARRLRKHLGSHLGLAVGAGLAFFRQLLSRPRYGSYVELGILMFFAFATLAGKAAICLDGAAIERLVARLEPFARMPKRTSLRFVHDYVLGLRMITEDRFTECYKHWEDLEHTVSSRRYLWLAPEPSRMLFRGGSQYVLGVLDSFAGNPRALERADALDADGLDIHNLIAAQLRMQYHAYQGDVGRMRQFRERVEAWGVQTGSAWQVQTWDAVARALLGSIWEDTVIAKSSVQRVESSIDQVPSLSWYRELSLGLFLLVRGQLDAAIEALELARARTAPFERHGWAALTGVLAETLNRKSEHAQALAVCDELFGGADPRDLRFIAHYIKGQVERAVALAGVGRLVEARTELGQLLGRHESQGNQLLLGLIHEGSVRVALLADEPETAARHLHLSETHFRALSNPALIARYKRLYDSLHGHDGGDALREAHALDTTLSSLPSTEAIAQRALHELMAPLSELDGYLFVTTEAGDLRLCASSVQLAPPMELVEMVEARLQELGGDEDQTQCGTEVYAPRNSIHGRRGDALRVYIYLLSYCDGGEYHGEGAIALLGRQSAAPSITYDKLQVIAQQLSRVRASELRTIARA